jgi:hypothetical protein
MRLHLALLTVAAISIVGCSKKAPTQPSSTLDPGVRSATSTSARPAPGLPGYEPAYVGGNTVTINAIEVPGNAAPVAQADFYEVVYPPDWQALGIAPPQCNPCDHDGGGIDFLDYHDHVLDSSPGSMEYRAPWHVFAVVPAYNGNASHDAAVGAIYRANLPLRSEQAVDALLATRLPGGAPVAVEVDTHFYFLCAVVNPNAMP